MVGEFEVANHGRRTRPKRWMVERLRPPSVSQKRVLVLAKAKGSDRKKKNTQPLHPACGDVLVRLDTAQFVRDRMTNRTSSLFHLLLTSCTLRIFCLPKCRGSSPVERGPEKAGVGSSTLPPGTIESATSEQTIWLLNGVPSCTQGNWRTRWFWGVAVGAHPRASMLL